jgi:phosphate transport system protein
MKRAVIDRPHTVSSYDQQLAEVNAIINRMADLACSSLAEAVTALAQADQRAADEIVAKDRDIDELELSLERLVLLTITSRGPMAEDLRYLIVAIRVGKMLERTGDQAKRIARRVRKIDADQLGQHVTLIRAMANYAQEMVENAMRSFNRAAPQTAREVIEADLQLNGMHQKLTRSCSEAMAAGTQRIGQGVEVISIGKQLERVGDYATNIAQDVIYVVTGDRGDAAT